MKWWRLRGRWQGTSWSGTKPIREELFGPERLEQHARTLAAEQAVTVRPPSVPSLHARLNSNAVVLLAGYRATTREVERGRAIVPAAEWLLDNYHLVEAQIREIREDLPPDYYRQLPKLASGPFAGYPRILGVAWAYVAHTDSRFDAEALRNFIHAYQRIQPLTIGELWAVAITLRVVLVENLRRLAEQISDGLEARRDADVFADQLLTSGTPASTLTADILLRSPGPLDEVFAAQLAKRLRDQDPRAMPALGWLEERLALQGTSIDNVVDHAQQRLGASNVSVRNVITSMRLISDIDWSELFEGMSLVDERLRTGSAFAAMDFPTRNLYRDAIEQLGRGSGVTELDIAGRALDAAALARSASEEAGAAGDPGYHLIGAGRPAFERSIGFHPRLQLRLTRAIIGLGIGGYVGAILLLTCGLIALGLWAMWDAGLAERWLALLAAAALLPASELATALVNRAVAALAGPSRMPGLELLDGVPTSLRTLVAVPTLLTSERDLLEQIERLEVHYLSGANGDLTFALLSDGVDAAQETLAADAPLLELAVQRIGQLNQRHGPGPAGDRFLFLHRRRLFNPGEKAWMGWERKRGKLHELNRLLRGATDTSFMPLAGVAPRVPPDVRYVITLDADTRLTRDAALRLVGKMAHPLNHPRFADTGQRVTSGYAILQPRVTPSLPLGRDGSLYQRVFSGPGGTDPYATTVSDVYQDLFAEGSYIGKGIYEVDSFEASLAGRIRENTLLSHDLFEGIFARSGLVADIEVIEDFPPRYDVAAKRQHRWMRGDWQLLPSILRRSRQGRSMSLLGRWKMLDNLRRAMLAPATVLALGLCCMLPLGIGSLAALMVISTIAVPALLPVLLDVVPRHGGIRLRSHFSYLFGQLQLSLARIALSLIFLADQAWRAADAAIRTLVRLCFTRRHLLEWTTAARSLAGPRLDVPGFQRQMSGGAALTLAMGAAALVIAPASWPLVLAFAMLWLNAGVVAEWVSRPPDLAQRLSLSSDQARDLRLIARRTWRYFETFVTADENMLPPDNFQETPNPVIAHRTSPTNIGLYLLATAAAHDFGWAGMQRTLERLEATFQTLKKLQRFRGHFLNWYGTRDLAPLVPAYVSSVDSGNLAGHLIALANACDEWSGGLRPADPRQGMTDALALLREAVALVPAADVVAQTELITILESLDARLGDRQAGELDLASLSDLVAQASLAVRHFVSDNEETRDVTFWLEALGARLVEQERDQLALRAMPEEIRHRLAVLAADARSMAYEMDFTALLDPQRRLLAIGYSLADNSLDASCYDLLASEARLASLIAIAKGDLPTRHWFRLGRLATPVGSGSALISWSGSMFEYLMPSLVMRAPAGTMLEQTGRLVVEQQQSHGRSLGIPWGISESAYNARDIEFTYQYSSFGVPGLGLKRGLADNAVVAPYATALASMVDPQGAWQNFVLLARMGARGRHGFYEALDFTRTRVPERGQFALVRCYMAHHQGMSIVAIANALHEGLMRSRFHREPMIMASELLLQERTPRDVAERPMAGEVAASADSAAGDFATVRRPSAHGTGAPVTHLLSNGHYAVMLTAAGGGYSRWGDIAVTRWREDATREDWGSFLFARDAHSGITWSVTSQPIDGGGTEREVVFGEDHAEFVHRETGLTSTLEIVVSAEHDGEVRRITLANAGRRSREIELTSYSELVLATPAADNAHPAFARMFVQTEYLPECGALLATRRLRTPGERQVWVAHFAVVEGDVAADIQYETDRAGFFGQGRNLGSANALQGATRLSNTVGTVLDPVFALRHCLRIAPGRSARVAFWTVVAASREELLSRIDVHRDRSAFDRARTLSWTQAQVQLRHLDVSAEEAADFQQLAAPLLYADRRFRSASETIRRGAGPQSGLWQHGISGDLPIVLLTIEDVEDMAQVRQLLRAHEYWRMKRLGADLVIINERASSYVQDLQIAIEAAVRTRASHASGGTGPTQGLVHVLRRDLMSVQSRALLQSVARVVVSARDGSLSDQLARLRTPPDLPLADRSARRPSTSPPPAHAPALPALEFFNGIGGFDRQGREYVVILGNGLATPAPWINVIANEGFGFQVSAEGGGYTWAGNSRENQITQWSNDAVADPPGDIIYIRDEATGALWTPTAQPIRDAGVYVARHGFGYSSFEHEAHGIASELLQFVPVEDSIRISRLRLTNQSARPRRLCVTTYVEWVLGTSRGACAPFIQTHTDALTGAILARNRWNGAFESRVAFADLKGAQTSWTADRTEFLGRNGTAAAPRCLTARVPLSGATGCGLDPCAALQTVVELVPGATVELVCLLGQGTSERDARHLIERYRAANLDELLAAVTNYWDSVLGAVQVKTPDRAMDIMLNGWLLYQTLACRIHARSAFYQASGAYGFRDQLQDGMALTMTRPSQTRAHLLRSAARQFVEGDMQHWWLPHSGQGVRTRIADDHVWLAFATATYIECSGDAAILGEPVPYLEGVLLLPGENEHFFQPMPSEQTSSLFEHCARGLDHALTLTGELGLPLIGTGDWNDGMNRVGEKGRGQSVWMGWFLIRTIALFAPHADGRDPQRASRWRVHAQSIRDALERSAWDGQWYRRATYDDGTWLGSKDSDECRIDSIAQSWAVLSGAAEPARAAQAMSSLDHYLIRRDDQIALLFTPPFNHTPLDPGYIKGYPPGLRENGGQYSHAAMWVVLAFAQMGDGDRAHELFALLNPVNHSRTPEGARRYKVEPYVVAADVYSVHPHMGRGGWTWYTGSAGWMYRAGVEGILGIRRQADWLLVEPCIPAGWPGFEVTLKLGLATCRIEVLSARGTQLPHAVLDGSRRPAADSPVRVPLDGRNHELLLVV